MKLRCEYYKQHDSVLKRSSSGGKILFCNVSELYTCLCEKHFIVMMNFARVLGFEERSVQEYKLSKIV